MEAEHGPTDEARELRRQQAAEAATALQTIGGLPGGNGRLVLEYEDGETEYGRPSRRPVAVVEEVREEIEEVEEYVTSARGLHRSRVRRVTRWTQTGERFRLKRQECKLVSVPDEDGKADPRNAVTVVASDPSDPRSEAEDAALTPDAEEVRYVDDTERLIAERQGIPEWDSWCAGRRERLARLRRPFPDRLAA